MLDDRKLDVLRAIVQDFVSTNEPVGSKALVERHHLGVSPATVRNDMAALEEEGYIAQPHTSAGRVPTDKGYRLFVDRLSTVKPLSGAERRAIEQFLDGALDLDDVVARTVRLLAQLTRQVAVVQYPILDRSAVRHLELIKLSDTRLMLVLITDTGRVEHWPEDRLRGVSQRRGHRPRVRHLQPNGAEGERLSRQAAQIFEFGVLCLKLLHHADLMNKLAIGVLVALGHDALEGAGVGFLPRALMPVGDVDEFGTGPVGECRDQINGELDVVEAQLKRLTCARTHIEADVLTEDPQQHGLEHLVNTARAVGSEILRDEHRWEKDDDVDILERSTHRLACKASL